MKKDSFIERIFSYNRAEDLQQFGFLFFFDYLDLEFVF